MYTARRTPVEPPNPSGLCLCGCGQATPIARHTDFKRQQIKGYPIRFIHGHHARLLRGEATSNWKGGHWTKRDGYVFVYRPDHPEANRDGYVYEHRLVAEQTMGRPLAKRERVHHLNGIKDDNRPENLVVLQSQSAHMREHLKKRWPRAWELDHDAARAASKRGAAARWGSGSDTEHRS